jgi:tRNA(Ile)-lysidine synthase TilS/MesJ
MSHFSEIVKKADDNVRHVLGLSGGKDSAALAIFIKEQYPEIHEKVEYFFSDTGANRLFV